MPKYYEISEAAAKRAKDMNSYSDYLPDFCPWYMRGSFHFSAAR